MTGLSFGTVVVLLGLVILVAWIPLGQRLGHRHDREHADRRLHHRRGCAATSFPSPTRPLPAGRCSSAASSSPRSAWLCYIGAGLGPGPRDGLMTGIAAKGYPLWIVRTVLELDGARSSGGRSAATSAWAPCSFAFGIGPIGHWFLLRLHLGCRRRRPRPGDQPWASDASASASSAPGSVPGSSPRCSRRHRGLRGGRRRVGARRRRRRDAVRPQTTSTSCRCTRRRSSTPSHVRRAHAVRARRALRQAVRHAAPTTPRRCWPRPRPRTCLHLVNFEFRYDPIARARARSGARRRDRHAPSTSRGRTTAPAPASRCGSYGWLFDRASGGGWVGAWGSHVVDALRWIFGEVRGSAGRVPHHDRRAARSPTGDPQPCDAEDAFTAWLRFSSGRRTGHRLAFAGRAPVAPRVHRRERQRRGARVRRRTRR